MAKRGLLFKSKEEFDASIDRMAKELKEYANDAFWLWSDDIGEILDRGFGTDSQFKDALNLYAQAKWLLIDQHDLPEFEIEDPE